MHLRTRVTTGAVIIAIMAYALWRNVERGEKRQTSTTDAGPAASEPSSAIASAVPAAAASSPSAAASVVAGDAGRAILATAKWGSRRGELGHERPQEGNAEGPMSFAIAGKDLLVVDQLNARMVRYGADGKPIATSEIAATVQDVAVAPNGNVMLLDRLGQKTVTVTDASGHTLGQLPLPHDPGTLTGVFVDGNDVYVEREHGALVRIGTTDGSATTEAKELQGRPSKDGQLLLGATMSGARVVLNAFDRKKDALRFARAIEYPRPTHGIVLLDTDARGTIYVGVTSGDPELANIACLDPADGKVLGRVALPTSNVPEESFRDGSVAADGTIVFAVRSDDGVEYRTARCP